jgi:Glyoxalase-like domain
MIPRLRALAIALLALLPVSCARPPRRPPPQLVLDHLFIMVQPGAPERAALEELGLRISPAVNHHSGQGTASVTVELDNAFVELLWPDAAVTVAPGAEAAIRKFRLRSEWRTSGWCPFGVALRRVPGAPQAIPFPTWSICLLGASRFVRLQRSVAP